MRDLGRTRILMATTIPFRLEFRTPSRRFRGGPTHGAAEGARSSSGCRVAADLYGSRFLSPRAGRFLAVHRSRALRIVEPSAGCACGRRLARGGSTGAPHRRARGNDGEPTCSSSLTQEDTAPWAGTSRNASCVTLSFFAASRRKSCSACLGGRAPALRCRRPRDERAALEAIAARWPCFSS